MENYLLQRRDTLAAICVWRMLRRPFCIPRGLRGHSCDAFWERIDIDIAGCPQCGAVHLCIDVAECSKLGFTSRMKFSVNSSIFCGMGDLHTNCIRVLDEFSGNSMTVCEITGFCVRDKFFSEHEFTSNVSVDDKSDALRGPSSFAVSQAVVKSKPNGHSSCLDIDIVRCYVFKLLLSCDAERCQVSEQVRMRSKLQQILLRVFKGHKTRVPGIAPNLIRVACELASKSRNVRLCATFFERKQREHLVDSCTDALMRLLMTLKMSCPYVLELVRFDHLVTGLLYLMRAGLNMRGISLLPAYPELHLILPLESSLQSFFGIRSKCITEIENIVKVNLRSLDVKTVYQLCMQNTGEVTV